ncbi:MAG: phosphotransferase enzyme family protein [Nanobdellota archaeon]
MKKEDLQEICNTFGLGTIREKSVSSKNHNGTIYRIKVSKGSLFPTTTILLKEHDRHSYTQLRLANNMLEGIKKYDVVPIHLPLKTPSGKTTVFSDGKWYSAYKISSNTTHGVNPQTLTSEQIASAGKTLAKFHAMVKHLPPQEEFQSYCFTYSTIVKALSFQEPSKTARFKPEIKTFLEEILVKLQHHFELYLNDLKFVDKKGDLQLIHGTFSSDALVFDEQDIVGIIEGEGVRFDHPGYDVIFAMHYFSKSETSRYNLDRLKTFLDAYKTIYSELEIEPKEIMVFLRHSRLDVIANILLEHILKQEKIGMTSIREAIKDLEYIEKNKQAILELFEQTNILKKLSRHKTNRQ